MLQRVGEGGLLRGRHRPGLWLSVNSHPGPSPTDVEAVWQDLHARLLSFIARRVSDRDSAEDILQEVMLRVHRHAAELNDVSAISAWMHEIARNAIIDHSDGRLSAGRSLSAPGSSWNAPLRLNPNCSRPKRAPSWPPAWSHC